MTAKREQEMKKETMKEKLITESRWVAHNTLRKIGEYRKTKRNLDVLPPKPVCSLIVSLFTHAPEEKPMRCLVFLPLVDSLLERAVY